MERHRSQKNIDIHHLHEQSVFIPTFKGLSDGKPFSFRGISYEYYMSVLPFRKRQPCD